ncbi:MAG: outer membrane beta-barrel protein [Deltaproteobacteria bacterium]|nr:outer membrane beta-barrel protein [Deltaproteobacteria bacterium]
MKLGRQRREATRLVGGLLAGLVGLQPWLGRAQYVPNYFPSGVPGFDQELGVTVVTRVRPLYEQPGIRVGSFIISPNLDESVGYNSNVLGFERGPGSPVIETNPRVTINSDWARNAFGASLSVDDLRYPEASNQDQTNWNATIGGAYTIGRSNLALAYGHLSVHENATEIGAPPSTTPIPYTLDDWRSDYTFDLGRVKITPNGEFSLFRFGEASILGVPSNESFLNSNVLQGGAAARYEMSEQRSLLLVLQGIDSDFINNVANMPSLSSTSGLAMGGIDYQYDGLWRYQLLGGLEVRQFAAAQFKTRMAPIAKGTIIWTPTGLTTVTATLLRTIDSPTQEASSGFIYNTAELRVDHEYRRNLLLNGETGIGVAEYLQNGSTQTQFHGSAGITWLLNRNMRLTGQYTFTKQTGGGTSVGIGPPVVNTLLNGRYTQSLFLLTFHVGI